MNFYQRHLGDYARDAGYLSLVEHGAYTLLLDWYYSNEKPIPRELAFGICKASSRAEKQAVDRVLRSFFQWDSDSGWRHKRVEEEIARLTEKREKARANIKVRWDREKSRKDTDVLPTNYERNTYPILQYSNTPNSNSSKSKLVPISQLLNGKPKEPSNGR